MSILEKSERGAFSTPNIGNSNQQTGLCAISADQQHATSAADFLRNSVSGKVDKMMPDLLGDRYNVISQNISDLINKDGETLRRIKATQLYLAWLRSNDEVKLAKVKAIVNARNYYETINDQANDISFNTFYVNPLVNEDISGTAGRLNNFIDDISNNFTNSKDIYNNLNDNLESVVEVLKTKEETLFDTIGKIQLFEKKYNVDVRKNLYEYERITLYSSVYNVVKIIYYSLLILYIIFGSFFKNKMYKNKTFYIAALIYIILPYVLKYIFASIIFIYEYITTFLSGNKKILSYNDIMQANYIDNLYTGPIPNYLNKDDIINGYEKFVKNKNNTLFLNNLTNVRDFTSYI